MNKVVTDLKADSEVPTGPQVYQAIVSVMAELGQEGIAKARQTEGGGAKFKFRGIDDVYNALAPILAKHNLIILPRILSRESVERSSNSGGRLCYTTVEAEYQIVSALDGSSTIARTFGEAMDSGDKSTNKAMAVAYKYMAIQTFCIPTEGDNDPDATVHQVASLEEKAVNVLRGASADKGLFKEAWERNFQGWKATMDRAAYARVVKVMHDIATSFPKEAPAQKAPPPPAEDFGIGDDEIPF